MDKGFSKVDGARCWECPYKDATPVPTLNPRPKSKIAIIGEAPGAYEAAYGIPFTGPSGDLLNTVLKHHNLNRSEVMISNSVLCRPQGNEDPPKAALQACAPRLHREISESGVDTIVSVGKAAAHALLDTKASMRKIRVGPAKPYKENPNVRVIATWHPAYCCVPETKILTSNLHWTQIQDLEIGDELIGFDEQWTSGFYEQRQLKPTIVISKERITLPCYKIITEKATVVVSGDHQWLAKKDKSYWTPFEWVRTWQLSKEPYKVGYYIDPWEEVNTHESGYIAGFLDGEGTVGHSQLSWSQNDGPTSDYMLNLVKSFGFDITKTYSSGTRDCYRYHFKGKKDSIRALGMFRPERLIKDGRKLWEGKKANNGAVKVLSVEFVGEQEVVAITTTEKTFIAEGLLSHNCLRSPDSFPDLVYDFGKIRQVSTNVWDEPKFRVVDDPTIAEGVMQRLAARYDRLILDIECGAEKDSAFVHPSELPLLCVGFAFEPKRAVVFGENAVNDPKFRDILRRFLPRFKLIAHNGKFDLAGLRNVAGKQNLWFDTMLASYCINERSGGHGLKQLSIERLGAPDYEQSIREYVPRSGNYADIPRDILYKYNAYDVVCTWDLYELFNREMSSDDTKKHSLLVRAANSLIELELSGINFDLKYNEELNRKFIIELGEIETDIKELVGYPINPRSVPQVLQYYASKGLILPTTGADFLKELSEKIDGEVLQFTEKLLHHRKRTKLYGTYVKGLAKRVYKDRVYTTYLLHGTTSGRLSSREPNLQNVVREPYIRNQFTAELIDSMGNPTNNVLVQLDYKQVEGRVIATLAQDEYLRGIFADESRDLFSELCNDVFGVGKWAKEQRVTMKSIFYGNAYGREAPSIAKDLHLNHGVDISVEDARRMMREFNALIPGVIAWQAAIKHKVLSGDDLITPYGRRRSFWLITDKNRKDVLNEALSFLPQSIASDICLEALCDVQPKLEGLAKLRLTIHDALVFECHRDRVNEASELVKKTMLESAQRFTDYVPFAVDVSVGERWGEL